MEYSTIAAGKSLLSPNPAIGIDLIYPTRGNFNCGRTARVVEGLKAVIEKLAGSN